MKLALLLSGHLRGFGPELVKSWDFLLRHDPDIYHVGPFPSGKEVPVESVFPKATVRYMADDPNDLGFFTGDGIPTADRNCGNGIVGHCWRNFYEVFKLMGDNQGRYDLVVRCRPDNEFVTQHDFTEYDPRVLQVPSIFSWCGLCDRWACGEPRLMDAYANFYNHMRDWNAEGEPRPRGNTETRLYHYLAEHLDLPILRIPNMRFHQVDAEGNRRNHERKDWGNFGWHGETLPILDENGVVL